MKIKVGSRSSPLAQAQVWEVLREIQTFHAAVEFEPIWVITYGDKDLKTSLRGLEATDFFTREVDQLLLEKQTRASIHSAKDLPLTIPQGICKAAITKGMNPSDVLVMRDQQHIQTLPEGAVIATSSIRREIAVNQLRHDFKFVDIRGPIEMRLQKLERCEVDGVVIAMAALIRLKLTHLNYVILPGETVENQGRLAILVREDDGEMKRLFASINYPPMNREERR